MRLIIRWQPPARPDYVTRLPQWMDRLNCLIQGHDDEIVLGARSVALRCRRCSWRSPGWHLDARGGSARDVRGDRPAAIGPRLFTTQ